MKTTSKLKQNLLALLLFLVALNAYSQKNHDSSSLKKNMISKAIFQQNLKANSILVGKNITVGNYFPYIDSLIIKYDSITPYKLTEHLLVRSNPWIIDRLQNTDYYRMMAKDSFVYDQKKMVALPKGALITIPNPIDAEKLLKSFDHTLIDINIPEFKLRIHEESRLLYEFPVRVGRNERKYLVMAGRIIDLKTKTGTGTIVSHVKAPDYYNPVNGHRYYTTRRDDQKVTLLPQIPFLETEINGIRHGQLIHPTTNPITLKKAYSNGCIGTKEADAWVIYYHAPVGTKINIRYDLQVIDSIGRVIHLKDIYGYSKKR